MGTAIDILPADFGPDTKLSDLPQELTLRDLGVKKHNLPRGKTQFTTVAELPRHMTLRDLGFTEADMPEVRDRINWAQQIRNGLVYHDDMPKNLTAKTRLKDLPKDMTLRDFGLAGKHLPQNISCDTHFSQIPKDIALHQLGFRDKDMDKLRDTANRNYQLRHDPVFVNVMPENLGPTTKLKELPKELTLGDLGLTSKQLPEGFTPDTPLSHINGNVTLDQLGFAKCDMPGLRDNANKCYALKRNLVHANAIPVNATPDTKLCDLPPNMTPRDMGLSDKNMPYGISADTLLVNLPKDLTTLRDLGLHEASMPALRAKANKVYLAKHGPIYKNIVPKNLSTETQLSELSQEMTLRNLGLTEDQVHGKINLDKPINDLPPHIKLRDLGVTKEQIPSIREHAVHNCKIVHGPMHWDVMPAELSPATELSQLPQDMTLSDLGLKQSDLPSGVPPWATMAQLPANATLHSLSFTKEDMPQLRQTANQNYQSRQGPMEITAATTIGMLPQHLTLRQLGVTDDALKRLPSWVTMDTQLGELPAHLTLADLGLTEESQLNKVRLLVKPNVHATSALMYYNGMPITADMLVADLPNGLTLNMLGVDKDKLAKYYVCISFQRYAMSDNSNQRLSDDKLS